MSKLVAWELVSLDDVMEAPEEWAFPYSDEGMEQANASGMDQHCPCSEYWRLP